MRFERRYLTESVLGLVLVMAFGVQAAEAYLEERTSESAASVSALPEVYLIGDSIRIGYCKDVARELAEKAVVKWPDCNCANSQNILINLGYWRRFVSSPKVIQFNCGHWDVSHWDGDEESITSIDDYRKNVHLIIRRLRRYYPGAKLVFATTTPMNPSVAAGVNRRTTEEIRRYNAAGVEVAKAEGVLVNDLFALAENWPASDWADYCHFGAAANARLGKAVADFLMVSLDETHERRDSVFDGSQVEFTETYSGVTRWVDEVEKVMMKCDWESGAFALRFMGAQATSWRPAVLKGEEVFFLPKVQPWGEEVHGGVPVCWPWFGKAPQEGLPKHGLVRYATWTFKERVWKEGLVYELTSNDTTRRLWPHDFRLELKVVMTGEGALTFTLTETNTGTEPFESAWGLHPYFAIAAATEVTVDGVRQPMPSVLVATPAGDVRTRTLTDLVRNRTISVTASDNEEWVVWNPGVDRTPLCLTLGPDEWKGFYCLEPCTRTPRPLAPGESRTHEVSFTVKEYN